MTTKKQMKTKKHAVYGILAMVSLLTLGITQSARADIVVNGGFETGSFPPWTTSGNNTPFMNVVGFNQHSGSFAASLGPIGPDGFLTQNLVTTPGRSYVLEYWLANPVGGTPSDFSASWNGTTILGSILSNPGAFGYTEYQFNVTASGFLTDLHFNVAQDPDFFYLDDVSVNSVPDGGSTVALLGFALAGLGILRRKLRS